MLVRFSLTLLAEAALQAQTPCADLTTLRIPDLIIEGARIEPAKAPFPEHCLVHGIIEKRTGVGGRTYGMRLPRVLTAPQITRWV